MLEGLRKTDQAQGLRTLKKRRPVKVIAVSGGKGGVGKTNVCANLAVAMAALGRKVMVLDADMGLANIDVIYGLQPRATLADVVRGECLLDDVLLDGPLGVKVVPGASGLTEMAQLGEQTLAALVHSFSDYHDDLDVLLIDTAPGITADVLQFAQAAHEVLIVVRDEPTSITDAYAVMKVLSGDRDVNRFRVVTNMTRGSGDGVALYNKLSRVTDRFLNVSLHHTGSIPYDERVGRAVQMQTPFMTAYPASMAALSVRKLAERADDWAVPQQARGTIEFFLERLLGLDSPELRAS
ncbi:MAG: MinD/ParA family protein [Gammaproteobacteria bacterium]|nr:MinD/ParA family protein [Gammaproteobacteria bacterium]NND55243.1 MinD/ParA family protein [Gammaproteobacteria bacterium]